MSGCSRCLEGVRNVVFLTTDTHANFVNEIRLQTLGGRRAGRHRDLGGGHRAGGDEHVRTEEIDATLGAAGTGSAIVRRSS